MARKPFVVIDAEILSSTVWAEPAHVRLVWITLLILCDTEGYVGAAIPGIARAAGVTLDEARDAMERLQQPDPDSRTKTNDGIRVVPAERGWRVLNFVEHLERLSAERKKARDRVRKHREKKRRERNDAECNVTVAQGIGNREQGIESRDSVPSSSIHVGREVVAPPRHEPTRLPADRAEQSINNEIRRLQLVLGEKLARLSEHPKSERMVPAWSRAVTSYTSKKGEKVPGVADWRTIFSVERLERSIEDADWWLAELDKGLTAGGGHGTRAGEQQT